MSCDSGWSLAIRSSTLPFITVTGVRSSWVLGVPRLSCSERSRAGVSTVLGSSTVWPVPSLSRFSSCALLALMLVTDNVGFTGVVALGVWEAVWTFEARFEFTLVGGTVTVLDLVG